MTDYKEEVTNGGRDAFDSITQRKEQMDKPCTKMLFQTFITRKKYGKNMFTLSIKIHR